LKGLEEAYGALDLTWLAQIGDAIERVRGELRRKLDEKEQCSNQRELCKNRLHILETQELPERRQALQKREDELKELFSPEYAENTGEPRYRDELERLKTDAAISAISATAVRSRAKRNTRRAGKGSFMRGEIMLTHIPLPLHPGCAG
jgi:hypothetical protein